MKRVVCFSVCVCLAIGAAWFVYSKQQSSKVTQAMEHGPYKAHVFVYVNSVADAYAEIEKSMVELHGSVVEPKGIDKSVQKASVTVSLQQKDAVTLLSVLSNIATDKNVSGAKSIIFIDAEIADTAVRTVTITLTDVALL